VQKLIFLGGLIVLAVGVFAYDYFTAPEQKLPIVEIKTNYQDLPQVTFKQFRGKALDIHQMSEPSVLLNFWASWCVICVAEMPTMIALIEEMQGKVALVNVSIDNTQQDAEKYQSKLPVVPHVYWVWDKDKQISLNQFNVLKTPETIIINKDRKMVEKIVGEYDWTVENLQKLMR
jgi:thiol-disulfide isomerase/thioredoxin